jgi:anaerobic magnesium-protoporphyrin IX monomethyl ester cyclase
MKLVLARPNSYVLPTAPPAGLAALAAWIRKSTPFEVAIIDARKERLSHAALAEKIAAQLPDAVGIGAMSVEAADALAAASEIRKSLPDAVVILGGPFTAGSPERLLADPNIDYVVIGEGEESLCELLQAVAKGKAGMPIAGVWGRTGGEIGFGGPRGPLGVDLLPPPAWDLLDIQRYFQPGRNTHDNIAAHVRCLQVMTSRGCPFRCIYCHAQFGKTFRPKAAEEVLKEIRFLVERYGIRAVEISDDVFNLDMDRAKTILRGIAPLEIAISFPNGVRGDRIDEEMLDLMEAAGTRRLTIAVESASPRVQNVIRKNLDLEKVRKTIALASRKRFVTTGFFMLGFPEETAAEMEETIRFAVQSDLHIASFFYLTPFPGTEAAVWAEERGLKADKLLRDYSTLYINLSAESDDVLKAMRKRAYRKFYANPRRIVRTFLAVPKSVQTFMNAMRIILLSFKDSVDH